MSRLRRALRATLVEYFKKTSLNGFGLLYFIRRRRYQRFFWFLFIAVGMFSASFVVFTTLLQFLAQPTVTSLSVQSSDVEAVPFPALTICSGNKLSRLRVLELAQLLANSVGNSTDYWLQQLPLLAGFFYPSAVPAAAAAHLQAALDATNWTGNVREQLLHLAPSCSSLLLSCHLDAVAHNCSQLFRLVPTLEGCCCVLQLPGNELTLTLRLNASRADDFDMPRLHLAAGFSLHLPGWLGRLSLAPGELADLQVRAIRLAADAELRDYPLAERGCHFGGGEVHCLSLCRLRASAAACNCAPYDLSLSLSLDNDHQNLSYCNLMHTACLQRLEASWSPWSCVECLPACDDWRYELRKSLLGHLSDGESKVSIRYGGQRVSVYRQDGLYNWYELLSNVGGVLSVCIGCSFISGFEFVYFMMFRLWHNWRQLRL